MAQAVQITRNNHYVARSYLGRFADSNHKVWVYRVERADPRIPVGTRLGTKTIGAERDLYTTVDGAGVLSDEYERWFEAHIDTPGAAVLSRILEADSVSGLTVDERAILGRYIVAQELRTPISEAGLARYVEKAGKEFQLRLHQDVLRRLKAGGDGVSLGDEQLREYEQAINNGEIFFDVPGDKDYWLGQFLPAMLDRWAPVAAAQTWVLVQAPPSMEFVASDQPVVKTSVEADEQGVIKVQGWEQAGTLVTMPLTPTRMLMTSVGERLREELSLSTADDCHRLNRRTIHFAHRYVVAKTQRKYIEQEIEAANRHNAPEGGGEEADA